MLLTTISGLLAIGLPPDEFDDAFGGASSRYDGFQCPRSPELSTFEVCSMTSRVGSSIIGRPFI